VSPRKQQAFQFDAKGCAAIMEGFAAAVLDSERTEYIAKAEAIISDMVATIVRLKRAKGESQKMRRCLARLRAAADGMIAVFQSASELNENSPLLSIALDLKNHISPATLRLYDPGFEVPPAAHRPRQTMQLIVLTNLRSAYLTATSGSETRCRAVVGATLKQYSRQRNGSKDMPTITLTDHAWRRMLGEKSGAIQLR
jgi:hypothetical protein